MSDPETPSLREELEARVIALLTGELPEADAEELEKILRVDEELSAFRDRMATLMGDIHTARDEIVPPAPKQELKLSEERRRAIFENINPVEPLERAESLAKDDDKKWWHLGLLEIAAMLLVGAFIAAMLIPSVGAVRQKAQQVAEQTDEKERKMFALETSIPPELIEGTPQPIRLPAPATSKPPPSNFAIKAQKPRSQLSEAYEVLVLGDMPVSGRLFSAKENDAAEMEEPVALNYPGQAGEKAVGRTTTSGFLSLDSVSESIATDQIEGEWSFDFESKKDASDENGRGDSIELQPLARSATEIPEEVLEEAEPVLLGLAGPVDPFAAPTKEPSRRQLETMPTAAAPFSVASAAPVDDFAVGFGLERSELSKKAKADEQVASRSDYDMNLSSATEGVVVAKRESGIGSDMAWGVSGASSVQASSAYSASGLMQNKLDKIKIPQVRFQEMPLSLVIKTLSELSVEYDYEHTGVNIVPVLQEGFDPKVSLNLKDATLRGILAEVSENTGVNFEENDDCVVLRDAEISKQYYGHSNNKLREIVIPRVIFNGMPLSQVVETLEKLSVEYDYERRGLDLSYIKNNADEDPRVNVSLRNLSLDRILQFVTQQVNYSYDVHGDKVSIRPQVQLSNAELAAIARNELVSQTPKPEKQTAQAPVSTFSLNVSDVSFELAQAALASQRIPSAELIRTEEFVNSFSYSDPAPREDEPVSLNWEIAQHPYQHNRQIVRFSLQTQAAGRSAGQPLNLNLLVDNSGSMQRSDRRAILEKSLQALQSKLTDQDQLNVVLFARQPKLIANASNVADQKMAIEQTLNYKPEGGTNLESGLKVAYDVAQQNFNPAASNRVILMTDGAANLGEVDAANLAQKVIDNRKQGIALDAYGIGWEDYNDALLEEITRNGDGRYAFLNDVDSAAEDFAEKLAGTLRVSAADVKVQILWNPERVRTYRQIGYDLHQLKEQDFRNNSVDAAENSEAESGTALYVVQIDDDANIVGGLGTLQIRYRVPATGEYVERAWQLEMPHNIPTLQEAEPSLRLAASSALFAERLANNPLSTSYSFEDLEDLTRDLPEAFPNQPRVVELQNMIQSANSLFVRTE